MEKHFATLREQHRKGGSYISDFMTGYAYIFNLNNWHISSKYTRKIYTVFALKSYIYIF